MERDLRSNTQIHLIGFEKSQILGSKLPTNKEVLQLFFYHVRTQAMSIHRSATLATREAILFWEKANIPTKKEQHCIDKLKKLYDQWRKIEKSSTRSRNKTKVHQKNESDFEKKINHIFDIAHSNVNKMISKEGQIFLQQQRSENRGSLVGVDKKAMQKEQRKNDRIEKESERKRRYDESQMLSREGCVHKICLF